MVKQPTAGKAYPAWSAGVSLPENIDTRLMFPKEELVIQGDATQSQQLLMNLLNNARDAVAASKSPVIHTEMKEIKASIDFKHRHATELDEFVLLSVSDNGACIAADKLDKVFEPFFTTKGIGQGTGLAMVFGCMQTHLAQIPLTLY